MQLYTHSLATPVLTVGLAVCGTWGVNMTGERDDWGLSGGL